MKEWILVLAMLLTFFEGYGQGKQLDKAGVREDLEQLLSNLSDNYVYLKDKNIDLDCLRDHYTSQIGKLRSEAEVVLLYEYVLDEFYDSHLILNTNRKSSFRLYAPVYVTFKNGQAVISQVWQTQIATKPSKGPLI